MLTYSEYEFTTVGSRIGPFTVGPTTAAPIGPAAAGKNDWSISLVNTPGYTIFSAICCLQNLSRI